MSWVIPGKLAVGGLPRAGDSMTLAEANIEAVLTLCARAEGVLPSDITDHFRCFRYILPDSYYIFDLQAEQLAQVVEMMHEQIEQDRAVYVHCLAGVERSPTACIAYLCQYQDLELWEAVSHLKQVHPDAMPTDSQLQVVRELVQLITPKLSLPPAPSKAAPSQPVHQPVHQSVHQASQAEEPSEPILVNAQTTNFN